MVRWEQGASLSATEVAHEEDHHPDECPAGVCQGEVGPTQDRLDDESDHLQPEEDTWTGLIDSNGDGPPSSNEISLT